MTQSNSSPFTDPALTWNTRFSKEGYVFGTEPNDWLRRHTAACKAGGRVLCVADGEGRNSVWLAKNGFVVDAFDIAEVGVNKARRLAHENGVQVNYSVASCDDFVWQPDHYDAVVAIFVQFADPLLRVRMFQHMVRSLRPGGSILLHGYTPKQLDYRTGGPSNLSHLYTPDLLRESFAALEVQVLEEYEAELAEGEGHHGRSAVIGMVATRR